MGLDAPGQSGNMFATSRRAAAQKMLSANVPSAGEHLYRKLSPGSVCWSVLLCRGAQEVLVPTSWPFYIDK